MLTDIEQGSCTAVGLAQPEGDRGRLHRLLHHGYELRMELIQVDLVAWLLLQCHCFEMVYSVSCVLLGVRVRLSLVAALP
jgi:hypothetical protein